MQDASIITAEMIVFGFMMGVMRLEQVEKQTSKHRGNEYLQRGDDKKVRGRGHKSQNRGGAVTNTIMVDVRTDIASAKGRIVPSFPFQKGTTVVR